MEHYAIAPRNLEVASSTLPSESNQVPQSSTLHSNLQKSRFNHHTNNAVTNRITDAPNGHNPRNGSASRFSQWTTEWIIDWWGIELVCWFVAALSLVAIVIGLESHKNQPIPKWHFGITLNSYISIFATIGQMAMMKPVVECIGQLKWLWFARKRRLVSFQALDDASRGPTGSLVLFWKLHGIHLVTLGAAITVISAAFSPFAQQIITYPLRLHPVGSAHIPQVFNGTASIINSGSPSPDIFASMEEGLVPGNFSLSDVPASCSTGNCSWVEYSSLGVCTSVLDLSSTIIYNACNLTAFDEIFKLNGLTNSGFPCFNYTLPKLALQTDSNADFSGITNASLTNAFPDISIFPPPMKILSLEPSYDSSSSNSVGTIYLMYQPGFLANSTLPSPVAFELNLNLCLHKYNTTVINGVTNTTILSSQNLETHVTKIFSERDATTDYMVNNSYISIGGMTFGTSDLSIMALSQTIAALLSSCYFVVDQANEEDYAVYCDFTLGFSFIQNLLNTTNPLSAITTQWENMAISMTNVFRTGAGGDTQVGQFEGTAFAPIAYVDTNYLWLILPITLVVLTLVFLLATITESQRLGSRVWKSSNLATLQGLHSELHTELGGLSSISEMEQKAKKVEVRFNLDLKGGKAGNDVEYRLMESKQGEYWK